MTSVLRHAAAHVFVDDLAAPVLSDDDAHHLGRVLRLRDGEVVTASNGAGHWRTCAWAGGAVQPTGDVHVVAAPRVACGVAFVPVKGERSEWSVQKLTEIGVDDIIVLGPTRRSVVRWTDADKQMRRLRVVAREAAMQSRRVWLPTVSGLTTLADVLATPGAAVADPDGAPLAPATKVSHTAPVSHTAHLEMPTRIVVGPEGGFDSDEIPAHTPRVSLGDTILRAETATLVAATLLMAHHARETR